MKRLCVRLLASVAAVSVVLLPLVALADPPPPVGAFEAHAAPPPPDDITRLHLQLGAALASGNSQSLTANGGALFLVRRGTSQFTLDGAANYSAGWTAPAGSSQGTARVQNVGVENYLGRARFDQFFEGSNAGYITVLGYRDVPSGFNSRESAQVGYMRNIVTYNQVRRLWVEVGYDISYENLVITTPPPPASERLLHSARMFVGYEDHALRVLDVTLGLEAIVPFVIEENGAMTVTDPWNLWRLNGAAAISSQIGSHFSLALSFLFRFQNAPLPGFYPLDTMTTFTLIYALESHPTPLLPPPSAPPPPSSAPPAAPTSSSSPPPSDAPSSSSAAP